VTATQTRLCCRPDARDCSPCRETPLSTGRGSHATNCNWRQIKKAAAALGVGVEIAEAERRDAIGPALDQLRERGASALIILGDSFFFNEHKLIVLLVTAARLPAIYPDRVYADAGGLIFYGPDITDNFRRAADYVDRILKGSKTSDLPVQQPTKFELIINATIAKAIGVTLPTTLLLRADEVID